MSIGPGSFRDLATCTMPPPCMEGYSQFRMPGTDSMCCRRTSAAKGSVRRKKPCQGGKVRCKASGKCILRRNLKKCNSGSSEPKTPRASKPGSINMKAAKELLRNNYSMILNGKSRAPGFITTLKGVTGKNPAEKIANLRRVLSTCKRVGVPLLKKTGKGFKAYSTLVSQCNVRMTTPVQNIFSQRPGKAVNNVLRNKLNALRARKSQDDSINSFLGVPNKSQDDSINSFLGMPSKSRATLASALNARPAAPVQNLDEFYQDALNTPLPNDFGMRRLRFGFRRY